MIDNNYSASEFIKIINEYEKKTEAWTNKNNAIDDVYLNKNNKINYNLFWSNIQTMLPALYAKLPSCEVSRRFKDKDAIGMKCAEVLERATNFMLNSENGNDTFSKVILDYLLYGRACLWVRYVPYFDNISADEAVDYEEVVFDHVCNVNFGHNFGEKWEDVSSVWRKIWLTKKELINNFGEVKTNDVLNCAQKSIYNNLNENLDENKNKNLFCVYEFWHKPTKKVHWFVKNSDEALKTSDDFLNLKDFFPCAKPIYSTITNNTLIPTQDYVLCEAQYAELNKQILRIKLLTSALRVSGVYNSACGGVQKLLDNAATDNALYPVDEWAVFSESGGIEGNVSWLPIDKISAVLLNLYQSVEHQKNFIYELTGISDLLRGDTHAQETATAQQIKSNYASMRFQNKRANINAFLAKNIQLMAEIISEKFSAETLALMTNSDLFFNYQEKFQEQENLQITQKQPTKEIQDKINAPTWQQVMDLLKNDKLRTFRINVATDSTIRADEEQEKASKIEMLTAVGGFLKEAIPAVQTAPELGHVLGQMLLTTVRAFKTGTLIENDIEELVNSMRENLNEPKKQELSPEQIKSNFEIQMQQMKNEHDLQMQQMKNKHDLHFEDFKLQNILKIEAHKQEMQNIDITKQIQMQAQIDMQKQEQEHINAVHLAQLKNSKNEQHEASNDV